MPRDNRLESKIRELKSIRRRQVVQSMIGGSAMLMAGCIGDDGDDGSDSGDDGDDDGGDTDGGDNGGPDRRGTYAASVTRHDNPREVQFNPYNPNRQYEIHHGIAERYMVNNSRTNSVQPVLFQDYERSGGDFSFQLRDEHTWHSGDEVTTEDVEIHWVIERELDGVVWTHMDDFSIEDDKTIVAHLSDSGLSDEAFLTTVGDFTNRLVTPRSIYQEYGEGLADATSDEETDEVLAELIDLELDEPEGCGIWKLADVDDQGFLFDIHDGHFAADRIEYAQGERPAAPGGGGAQERVALDGLTDLDSSQHVPTIEEAKERDDLETTLVASHSGRGITFNANDELFAQRKFRLAMMRAMDREHIFNVVGRDINELITVPCGLEPVYDIESLLPNVYDDLLTNERDLDEAYSLLEEIGCTQEGDDWFRPNGDPLSIEILAAAPSNQEGIVNAAASSLQEAGFDVEPLFTEFAVYAERKSAGDYDAAHGVWLAGPTISSSFSAMVGFRGVPYTVMSEDDMPIEVPPVGDHDTDERISVDYYADAARLASQIPDEERTEIMERLAWTYNWVLPMVPYNMTGQTFIYNVADWEFPAPDHNVWGIPNPFYMISVLEGYPKPR